MATRILMNNLTHIYYTTRFSVPNKISLVLVTCTSTSNKGNIRKSFCPSFQKHWREREREKQKKQKKKKESQLQIVLRYTQTQKLDTVLISFHLSCTAKNFKAMLQSVRDL